jgi:hypothetical protein
LENLGSISLENLGCISLENLGSISLENLGCISLAYHKDSHQEGALISETDQNIIVI